MIQALGFTTNFNLKKFLKRIKRYSVQLKFLIVSFDRSQSIREVDNEENESDNVSESMVKLGK